jgi:hypothetical protein
MTTLGKITVIAGICIFTASTLLWIIQGDWQWFAGGGAIFLGTLLSGAVISAETKPSPTRTPSPVPLKPNKLHHLPFPFPLRSRPALYLYLLSYRSSSQYGRYPLGLDSSPYPSSRRSRPFLSTLSRPTSTN